MTVGEKIRCKNKDCNKVIAVKNKKGKPEIKCKHCKTDTEV